MSWEPSEDQIKQFAGSTGMGFIYSKTLLGLAQRLITNEDLSDGYHSFKELYRFRMLYNAALFNAWWRLDGEGIGDDFGVHKSKLHHDGAEPFDDPDWFIVVAQLPTGQISNHYRISEAWDLFVIPERKTAAEWDGHTAAQASERLEEFLR